MNARILIWRDVGTGPARATTVPLRLPPLQVTTLEALGAPQVKAAGSDAGAVSFASSRRAPTGSASWTTMLETGSLPQFVIVSVYVSRPFRAIVARFCSLVIVNS